MLFKFFIGTISLSPLFFGSNRPWSWSLYSILISCFGILYFSNILLRDKEFDILISPLKYPLILVSIPILWSLIQVSPWVPINWSHPFWTLTAEQIPLTISPSISLTPSQTITALMKLMSYLLVFFLSFQFSRQSDRASLIFNAIAYTGAAYALYGLLSFFEGNSPLPWLNEIVQQNSLNSTFINRNSYATYAGLSLLTLFPLLLGRIKESLIYGVNNYYGLQYFIENLFIRSWLSILLGMITCTALFLTHSRGGFLSSILAILIFFLTLSLAGKFKSNNTILILTLVLSVVAISFWNSGDKLLDRLDTMSIEREGRLNVYKVLGNAISENYWLGTGYGSFEKSFRLYRDKTVKGYYTAAHSSYLENMFELGILQALALFSAGFFIAIKCLQGIWKRQKNWVFPAIGFSATVLVGTHALVDFSLQIPAIAYTYALLMGAAFAQSLPKQQRLPSRR